MGGGSYSERPEYGWLTAAGSGVGGGCWWLLRHTDTPTVRQADRQTDRQIDGQTTPHHQPSYLLKAALHTLWFVSCDDNPANNSPRVLILIQTDRQGVAGRLLLVLVWV